MAAAMTLRLYPLLASNSLSLSPFYILPSIVTSNILLLHFSSCLFILNIHSYVAFVF